MSDSSLFSNKWRHHDIIAIVENLTNLTSWFHQTPCYLSISCSMASSRGIWTLPNNLEILRHNDVKLCHVSIKLYLEMLEIISALICVHLVETIPR